MRASDPDEYLRRARESIVAHVEGMLEYVRLGAYVFDYGNNLRGEAREGGVAEAFSYPGFVPAYIRPLFCRGIGPFRWAVLSGDPADIATIDAALRELFPDDPLLQRWLELAPERVAFQGLPARICWLGYGDRAKAGLAMNELVRSGAVKAPVVIGRDHLDAGSVASPYRETEAMRDGSDAIADWPILNALVNVAAGATWVSVHHGGGVGIGNSIHAGMVVLADGTAEAAERLERVLTTDPGMGVMRHVDAGYDGGDRRRRARRDRRSRRCRRRRVSATRAAADPRPRAARDAGRAATRRCAGAASARSTCSRTRTSSARGDTIEAVGRMRDLPRARRRRRRARRARALRDPRPRRLPHARGVRRRPRRGVLAPRRRRELRGAARRGGGILSTVRATRAAGEDGLRAAVERHRGWMLAHGTTTFEGKSGYGLDRDTELASLRAVRDAGGVPTWLGAHAVPPEFDGDADAYLDFALAEVLPEAAQARRGGRRLPRARRVRRGAGAPLPRGVPRRPGSRCACTATSSPSRARSRSRSSSARARSTTSRRPATTASRALAASDVVGVLLPASALFLGRPMPPARALVDAGAAVALATDFNPGSAFCESLPLCCSLAATQLQLSPAEALSACTVNAAHVLGRADRLGRLAPGLPRRRRRCSTRRTGATSRTTSAADLVDEVVRRGRGRQLR